MDNINVILDDGAFMPKRAYPYDAGLDIFTPVDFVVPSKGSATIDTGVHMQIPKGYVGMLKSKSGLNVKHSLVGEGVVDAFYNGSIRVKLYNHGDKDATFARGDKVTQIVIMPIVTPTPVLVDTFPETDRGNNGFGSTGR